MRSVALVAALLLAGCTTMTEPTGFDPSLLSKPHFDALPVEELAVVASDGVILHGALFRPDTSQAVPVFVNFSPYWGDSAADGGDAFAHYMVDHFVPRGYAVALIALRGTGHSGGCFPIGGDREIRDAYEVVDHFAKAPWSNGLVAAGGKSYDSTTQNGLIAKMPHPALRGIFHVSAITDMYRYNAKDGVPYWNGLDFTPRYFVNQGLDEYGLPNPWSPLAPSGSSPEDEDPESLQRLVEDACPEAREHVISGEGTASTGRRDSYWREREWGLDLAGSPWNGSVFFVHGLQDWNVKPDHIDPWLQVLQQKGIRILGWLHQDTVNLGHVYPMRADWNLTMERWLDYTLKGIDTHLEWGFQVEGSDGIWRSSPTWPPQTQSWNADMFLQARDVPMRVAGTPTATVAFAPSGPDGIARLTMTLVAPDGSRTWVNEAVRRLALSDDLTQIVPYVPGSVQAAKLTFFPMDLVVPPGYILEVATGGPTVALQPEDATPAAFFYRPDQVAGTYWSHNVALPVAELEAVIDPQPVHQPCWTC